MARKRVPKAVEMASEAVKTEAVKMAEDLAKGAPDAPKNMEAGKAE
jgi:hypothetical protein